MANPTITLSDQPKGLTKRLYGVFRLVLVVSIFIGGFQLLIDKPKMTRSTAVRQQITVVRIATNLRNPRGVAVFSDGRLLVTEAGDGAGEGETGGHMSVFNDSNNDGDYDDPDEQTMVLCCVQGYNSLIRYNNGRDEVGGLGDVVLLEDGRGFYTKDDPLSGYAPDGQSHGVAIIGLTPDWQQYEVVIRDATMNALVYNPDENVLYVAESGLNRVSTVTLDGTLTPIIEFPDLAHDQQPVPAGLARDPRTGELLVALFSGHISDYYGSSLAYLPEDARIVRLDPETGEWHDEIIGLTTAVDVTVDEMGNIYVVEMATGWPTAPMPPSFPLFDPNAPPDAGGYPRFSGRVTMYPADGSNPMRLADELDTPTNITYADGALYVSVGQGTPGRAIIGPGGRTHITGEIYRITGFRP